MPDVLVRGLPDELKQQLAARARKSGHSLSAEVQELVKKALAQEGDCNATLPPGMGLGTYLASLVPDDCKIGDDF